MSKDRKGRPRAVKVSLTPLEYSVFRSAMNIYAKAKGNGKNQKGKIGKGGYCVVIENNEDEKMGICYAVHWYLLAITNVAASVRSWGGETPEDLKKIIGAGVGIFEKIKKTAPLGKEG